MENQAFENQLRFFPEQEALLTQMKVQYNQKLYHELTESLLRYIREPSVVAQGKNLISFYENFISSFETKLDAIKFVKIIITISDYYDSINESIDFLNRVVEKSVQNEDAKLICELKKAIFVLRQGNQDETLRILQASKDQIKFRNNVETLVFSQLHRVSFLYYRERKNFEQFYASALQFLAYTPAEDLTNSEKQELPLEMAIALLTSPKIYNYSELLDLPLLLSLRDNPQQGWVYELLQTYNRGDVQRFKQDLSRFKTQIASHAALQNNISTLEEKIRTMAFLDLLFNLPKNERTVSFEDISRRADVPLSDVELLVMSAMSLGLLRGHIDQIDASVYVEWIVPRVLDKDRIRVMRDKFDQWEQGLKSVKKVLSDATAQEQ